MIFRGGGDPAPLPPSPSESAHEHVASLAIQKTNKKGADQTAHAQADLHLCYSHAKKSVFPI